MKATLLLLLIPAMLSAADQDIIFTNQVASFTNLDGRFYTNVTLVKADLDGVIWRDESGGGRVCFTNLHPALLQSWSIPLKRIELARERAGRKAINDAKVRAELAAQAAAQWQAKQETFKQWAAIEAAKQHSAQQQADLARLQLMAAQIAAARNQLKHEEAYVADFNMANMYNEDAPTLFIRQSARVTVEDAQAIFDQAQAAYLKKYGGGTNGTPNASH